MPSTPQNVSDTRFRAPKPAISQFEVSDLKPEKKLKTHQKIPLPLFQIPYDSKKFVLSA